ncbi:MAG: glycosyltransferase family 9 protein [Desulfobacterales bacterium]|nr:glycosyltransferase family 9 protein [Desulfobacterales bacterium]
MNLQKEILIIHQGALGDVITIFPAITRLKKKYTHIDVICQNQIGKLACELKVFDKFFPLESAAFATLYSDHIHANLLKLLQSYHIIIIFSFSAQFEKTFNKFTNAKIIRILPRPEVNERIRVSEYILSSLIKSGLIKKSNFTVDTINENYCHRSKLSPTSKTIWIHPGSGSRKKMWSIFNFMEIEKALKSEGMKPEFILGPAEQYLSEVLESSLSRSHGVIHFFSDLIELVSSLKNVCGFIGNDSGLTHLAAFLGLPTVAIFGPSDPQRWKPAGRSVATIRPLIKCEPCFERNSDICQTMECFTKTSPETVLNSFYKLLALI